MTLLLISFVAGVLTVLSPCVLPLLPVIVGGSVGGGRSTRRALTVTASLGVSVFIFTFLLKVSSALVHVPQSFWNYLSGGLLVVVGVFFLFPTLWEKLPGLAKANAGASRAMSAGFMKQSVWGDILVGAVLSPVFSTCSPTYFVVLATVLPASFATGVVDILAYIIGMCAFLLIISIAGQKLLDRLGIAADPRGVFRRVVGVLFIIVGVVIALGAEAAIERPLYSIFDETKIEQKLLSSAPMPQASAPVAASTSPSTSTTTAMHSTPGSLLTIAQKDLKYQKAPEIVTPDGYFNAASSPTLAAYRGNHVVLVDFWDYSCINCQRTEPFLNALYAKYKDEGLVLIGVHTPEFAFEHLQSNVEAAAKAAGIQYPVVLDNEYQTWNAYSNQYWPREYLVDVDGYIVHDHTGEGGWDESESAVKAALTELHTRMGQGAIATSSVSVAPPDLNGIQSPETYFGASRNQYLGNGTPGKTGAQNFTLPTTLSPNTLYLGGTWNIVDEYAEAGSNATVEYFYSSKNIYMVAESPNGAASVTVTEDGVAIPPVTVTASTLYPIIMHASAAPHTIKLSVPKGVRLYTFTFG